LSIGRATIYRYLHSNVLKAVQIQGKTFIRKSDIDAMFDNAEEYRAKPSKEQKPISEFYTVSEIKEKYNIKESWLYKVVRENQIPKTLIRGKSYFSKEHIDKYFEQKAPKITEFYTVEEAMQKYNLTRDALYWHLHYHKTPRKKEGRYIKISKQDLDKLFIPIIL
jgi:predicted DNA-binding transcriptional regulator AlpA